MKKFTMSFKENKEELELFNYINSLPAKSNWIKNCCMAKYQEEKKKVTVNIDDINTEKLDLILKLISEATDNTK